MTHAPTGFAPTRRTVLVSLGTGLCALALPRASFAANVKTLHYGLSTFPPSIKPWENTGAAANTVKLTMHRGLMGYDGKAQLKPEVAESFSWPDDKTAIFKLRANAVFHNGKPVTAKDVVYSFDQILAKNSTAYLKSSFSNIDKVEAVDDHTVKFSLKAPSAVFTQLLANYCAPIVWSGSTSDNQVGCGPYKLKSQERGTYIEVEKFEGFYGEGEPVSDQIRFIAYPDENLRYAALTTGDVDMIEYLPWSQFGAVAKSDQLHMASTTGPFMLILFNVARKGPFANAKVRQAIGYAVKREDVIQAAFDGHGTPLLGFPNPAGSPFTLTNPKAQWSYDPARAKKMLAEAGYPKGFSCTLLATSTYAMHQDTASVVQAYLQQIGINAKLNLPDWATRVQDGKNGDYDIAVHGLGGYYNDPDSTWPLLHSGAPSYTRSYGFTSKKIDNLLEQGRAETDHAKRQAIYEKLYVAYFEEVPQVPLNWRVQADALNNHVTGFMAFPGWLNSSSAYSLDDTALS